MPDDTRLSPVPAVQSNAPMRHAPVVLPRTPLAFVWHYVRNGFAGHVALMGLFYGLSVASDATQAFVLGGLVNALADKQSHQALLWFGGLCVTWFSTYAWSNAYGATLYYTQMKMRVRIHEDMFAYLLDHAPRYFLDHISGALAHKIRTAATSASGFLDIIPVHVTRFTILFTVTGAALWRAAPQLLLPGVGFVLAMCAAVPVLAWRLRALSKSGSHAAAEQAGRMADTALNWELVRSFTATAFEKVALGPFNRAEATTITKLRFATVRLRMILHTLCFGFLAWLAWQSFGRAQSGAITVGTFTMLITLFIQIGAQIRAMGDVMFGYFENIGLMNDALSTILRPHEIVDPPGAEPLRVNGGSISIRDIDFDYPDGTPVFRNFSLDIAAGEKVGLVGASGAGKSTLIKLLRRQFPLRRGDVLIDGQDVAHVTWESVHDVFAEVPQNPGMFHRSVRENIAYGRPDATEAEIVAAAKLAHCHEFIASRAQGYASIVGEKGMKLSGGERQRVAIARAFLKNAPVLLLDEATSSLDSEAEHLIQDALLDLMEGRTVIAIAHRLSTIMHLDRIVVLEAGRIVEQGTHAALLANNGAYAKLWQRQAGGFM